MRRALLHEGPHQGLSQRQWIFRRALNRADLGTGDYLANLAPSDGPASQRPLLWQDWRASPLWRGDSVVLIQRPDPGQA